MTRPNLLLRSATRDDLDVAFELFSEIQSIHASAEPQHYRQPSKDQKFLEYFNAIIEAQDQHFVFCCADGREIGYIQYFLGTSPETIYQPERRIAYIAHICVTEHHRGSGCGTTLIEHVKAEAKRQNVTQIGLEFWLFNVAARACFEKAGFEIQQGSMWLDL